MLIPGTNTSVSGSGSAANPYVIDAEVPCEDVRQCVSAGDGLSYDPATGVIEAKPSPAAGNNLVVGPDGLYVPTGSATVTVGCGLTGDGSGSAPVTANTGEWPYPCDVDTSAGGVYCDTTGVLRGAPPVRTAFFGQSFSRSYTGGAAVSASDPLPDVETVSVTVTNPDPCRPCRVLVARMADVDFTLPPGARAAFGINGDNVGEYHNSGTGTMSAIHNQAVRLGNGGTLEPGASTTYSTIVQVGRGQGGATYTRIQADIQVWVFSDPQE